MSRLINKKGFTLVELMIVVVVLGILVGIAVPIYSMVTANAKRNTCFANMRMITSACVQYYLTHSTYQGLVPDSGVLNLATDSVPEEFIEKFDSAGVPKCPAEGVYVIRTGENLSDTTISVRCESNGADFEGHGDYHPSND